MTTPTQTPGGDTDYYWLIGWILGELVSVASILLAVLAYLPAIATSLAIVWYTILIYESRTFHSMTGRGRGREDYFAATAARQEDLEHLMETPPPPVVDPVMEFKPPT